MEVTCTPLQPGRSPRFGVEVHGLPLDGSPTTGKELLAALDTHRLLLFRSTGLSDAGQVDLMRALGEPTLENPNRDALHSFVSNTLEDGILGGAAFAFHLDHVFMPDPIEYLSLAGVEVPPGCGATRFADMVGAAATLPTELRNAIESRSGQNIVDPTAEPDEVRMRVMGNPKLPQAAHPALRAHPRTGALTLFVNEQQTEYLSGLPRDESDALLEALFAHLYQDAHLYVHEWQPGDLIIWDNQALQHARPRLDPNIPRTLRRVSVGGCSVFEFFAAGGPMHPQEATS